MARRARTATDIKRRYDSLEDRELVAAVCERFCQGQSPTEIRESILEDLRRKLTREQPYQILSFAAMNGWLQFVPPVDYSLGAKLKDDHPWLEGVEVVHSGSIEQVAARAARVLLQLVRQTAHSRQQKTVRIGLAGGLTVLETVKHFGQLLSRPRSELPADLPKELCFHAMVTGLQLHDPRTDPNTFFNYLSGLVVETDFVALHGPALPTRAMIDQLRKSHAPTQEAFELGEQIDIIVTSGASWKDEDHSQLRKLMLVYPNEVEGLQNEGCVADMLWQPVNERGPIKNESRVRALTLLRLDEMPDAIRKQGKKVLLVLGPCSICSRPRDDVLRTLLNLEDQYFTHLVAETRTASL